MARVRFIENNMAARQGGVSERVERGAGQGRKVERNMCEYFAQTDLIFYGRCL